MPGLIGTNSGLNTPRDFVQSGWDYFRLIGGQWITLSQQALGDITNFDITPIAFDATFDLTVDYGSFVRPVAPVVPDLGTIDVDLPAAPTNDVITIPDLGEAPAEPDFTGLTYSPPAAPDAAMPTLPPDIQPTLDEVTLPDLPTYVLPDSPTLYALDLPDPPSIVLPEFDAERPTFDFDTPDTAFNWQEVAYSSTLLDAVKDNLASMLEGGLGLPAAIEQAIFDRGRSRADVLARKRVQERAEDLGSRGLYEPAGYLARALDQAREEGRAEAAGHNRDITIRAAEIEVESIRFALQQAGALEIALLRQNSEINQRALEAAKIASDIQVQVFNALVNRFNLDVTMYQADAAVFRERLQAKVAEVDVYRAQIEGQKAIGDINEGLVRAYAEEVRSIQALADMYRAQIEGAKVASEMNTQKLEQARLRVSAFSEEVRAWSAQQEGYRSQVEAQLGNVRVYEAVGNLYSRRVEAYRIKGDAYIQQGQFQLAQQTLGWDGYRAALEAARVTIQAQAGAIDATARTFGARASMYEAEGRITEAESAAHDRTAQLRLAVANARLAAAQTNANMQINQSIQIGTLYLEQLKAKAQVVSQLASATMSGVNFGASYSGSLGHAYSMNVGYSYSGEAADYNGTPPSF
jgi:hypothetical protein